MKILIINIFGIGDVLFTTPLIRNIKDAHPDSFIAYVGNKRTAPILETNPLIDKVFVYERDDFFSLYQRSRVQFLKEFGRLLKDIKKEKFDLCLDLSLNGSAGFLTCLIGIPKRIGFNYKGRNPFLTTKVPLKGYEDKHVVEYYLDLLEELNIPARQKGLELTLNAEDREWAEETLKKEGISDTDQVIGMVPGGGASWGKDASFKRWGAENYTKLADKIIEKSPAKIILMGGQNEEELCLSVARAASKPPITLTGRTTVRQFAALLERCQLAIVNDGGPLHLAVAVKTKTVSIFGPVDPKVYGPFPQDDHQIITKDIACRPCYRRFRRAACDHVSCLNGIGVDEVWAKVQEVLKL